MNGNQTMVLCVLTKWVFFLCGCCCLPPLQASTAQKMGRFSITYSLRNPDEPKSPRLDVIVIPVDASSIKKTQASVGAPQSTSKTLTNLRDVFAEALEPQQGANEISRFSLSNPAASGNHADQSSSQFSDADLAELISKLPPSRGKNAVPTTLPPK